MNIKPLFDKVVVESVQTEEKTKSGFILPSSAQEKPQTARVVAVGPGGNVDGKDVKWSSKSAIPFSSRNIRAANSKWTEKNSRSFVRATFWQLLNKV